MDEDFISDLQPDNTQSPSMVADLELTQLLPSQQKAVHLVTWSRANENLLPNSTNSRECFGRLLEHMFNEKKKDSVMHWACSKEKHKYFGYHFHVAMQFNKKSRWLAVANELRNMEINVHFQSFHTSYKDAYEYVTKEDNDFVTSSKHPKMLAIPPKSMSLKRPLQRPLQFFSQES